MEDEQHPFWKQVQIQKWIWITNPRSRIAFEFEPNLLEVQTCLKKNLINFLFALTFQNVNLDWHGCMVKSEVSIQAPPWTWFERKMERGFEFELNQTKFTCSWFPAVTRWSTVDYQVMATVKTMGVTVWVGIGKLS
jgi:hypothetical protein